MKLGWQPDKSLVVIFDDYLSWVGCLGDTKDFFSEAGRLIRQAGVVRHVHAG